MTRLRVRHVTGFSYPDEVTASYNEARMLPAQGEGQFVVSAHLRVDPVAVSHDFTDYWGTRVASFEVLGPHRQLSLTATSVVEVGVRAQPSSGEAGSSGPASLGGPASSAVPPSSGGPASSAVPVSSGVPWSSLGALAAARTASVEQLVPTPSTTATEDLRALAETIRRDAATPAETALRIATTIGERMEYKTGVTSVRSTASQAWEARAGVCQDIAHVTLAALRAVDIPARYVSGYLHPRPDAPIGETVIGESHAWVEWLTDATDEGDAVWTGFDPTNRIPIEDRHVVVGRGRDYNDVPPLRGVYAGSGSAELFVSVELTRES